MIFRFHFCITVLPFLAAATGLVDEENSTSYAQNEKDDPVCDRSDAHRLFSA